jgi:hypothetical protein
LHSLPMLLCCVTLIPQPVYTRLSHMMERCRGTPTCEVPPGLVPPISAPLWYRMRQQAVQSSLLPSQTFALALAQSSLNTDTYKLAIITSFVPMACYVYASSLHTMTLHNYPILSYPSIVSQNHALTARQCHEQEPEQPPSPPREPHLSHLQGSLQSAPQLPHHCSSFRRTPSAKTRQLLRLSAEETLFWVSTSPPNPFIQI